jgi:hypothetical protein
MDCRIQTLASSATKKQKQDFAMDCRIQTLASSATKKQKQWTIFCWAAPSVVRSGDRGLEDYIFKTTS